MQHLRKTLLLSFLGAYFVFCPLLLLYSFGRILKPGASEDSSGLIFLSSHPAGATISVEGRRFRQKTPAALAGMLPGSYTVTLSLEDCQPWQYKIQVFPKLASVFDKILLLPKEWKAWEASADSFKELVSLPLGRFFILAKGERLGDYYSFDAQSQELTPFLRPDSALAHLEAISFFKVEASSMVIVKARDYHQDKYLLIEQEKGYVNLKDITNLFPKVPQRILWDPRQPYYLFSFQDNSLNKIDVSARLLEPNYLDRLRGCGIFENKLYLLKDTNAVLSVNYDRTNQRTLINDPILGNFLFGDKGFFEIKPLDHKAIIFLGEGGMLLSSRAPHRIVPQGVRGIEFHRRSKRALIWMENQAGIIDFEPLYAEQPTQAASASTKGWWFYTKGRDIRQGFWAYGGNYIILNDADRALIFELKAEGEIAPNQIVKIKSGSELHYLESAGKLYYLDPATKKVNYVEIINQEQAGPLSFKEYLRQRRK